jgi:hypothetical protein
MPHEIRAFRVALDGPFNWQSRQWPIVTINQEPTMTLNADIFREILRQVECHPAQQDGIDLQINGYAAEMISEHVRLLRDAGYLEARTIVKSDREVWKPICLTFLGRDFLDVAIFDMVWDTAKDALRDKQAAVTLDALSTALRSVAHEMLVRP